MACCNCLSDPRGEYRSSRQKFVKLLLIVIFLVTCSQLFALLYNFVRLGCYLVLDPREYPPKPLPRRFSLLGIDVLQFDRSSGDESLSTLYLCQSISAAVLSLLYVFISQHALCAERFTLMTVQAIILLLIVCITLFGSISFRALIPLQNIVAPVLGGTLASVIQVLFRVHFKQTIHYSGTVQPGPAFGLSGLSSGPSPTPSSRYYY